MVVTAELYGTAPPPPVSLQISPATVTVHLGQNTKFIATDDQGRQRFEAVWTISDPTIASLSSDSSPTLTPITYGEVTVTATIGGVSAQAHVIVAPSSLQVTSATVNMVVGESRQFTVVDSFGNPSTDVSWSVSDSNLATISSDNPPTLTAKNPGMVTLTATIEGVSGQAQVTISLDGVLLPGDALWSSPTAPGFALLQLTQAMPSYTGPALYSIETNGTTQSIVKALSLDGRQRWQRITSVLNGNSVPDRNGGLIVTQNNTCFPRLGRKSDPGQRCSSG